MYKDINMNTSKKEIKYLLELLEKDKENCKDKSNFDLRVELNLMLKEF